MPNSDEDLNEVLSRAELIYDNSEINQALDNMAVQLNERLKDTQPLLLCVLNGGIVFTGHLVTRLNCFPEIDCVHATRYGNETNGNTLDWRAYPKKDLKNRTVVILDDILDEGITLKAIIDYCKQQGAKEVVTAVLVKKLHDRCLAGLKSDYVGLEVEDKYVFGFGMDYKSQLRHLDGIYALNK